MSDAGPRTESALDPDAIEESVDGVLDDWRGLIDPVIDPIEALVDRAESFDELSSGLASLVSAMDVTPIAEHLARASFSARLAGDADVGRATVGSA